MASSSSRFLNTSLSFMFFFLISNNIPPSFSSPTHPTTTELSFSSTAEKLIRGFNLFPKDPINTLESDSLLVAGNIVEKKLTFPSLVAPGSSVEELGHHAGYYSLPRSKAARMFYFFFESRNRKDDPVVIWLTGGPGCSSELALFYENGPFQLTKNLSLVWNDYGWDKASNIIFVDQPTGTGFSYTSDESDIRHDEEGVSNDLYDFLQAFFKEHPQFTKNDFYITGESYAGHYIPALASRVHQGNKAKEGIHINLKGFAIGNGLTNPEIQYQAYTDYALDRGLIEKADYNSINKLLPSCKQAIEACGTEGGETCETSLYVCKSLVQLVHNQQNQLQSFASRHKFLEDRLRMQNEGWISDVRFHKDQISQLNGILAVEEKNRSLEEAKADLAMGLKHREAAILKWILEHTEDELGDLKAWFEILSRKSSVREDQGTASKNTDKKKKGTTDRGNKSIWSTAEKENHSCEIANELSSLKGEYDKLSLELNLSGSWQQGHSATYNTPSLG